MGTRNHEIEKIYIEQLKTVETLEYYFKQKEAVLNRKLNQCRVNLADISKDYKVIETNFIDPEKPTKIGKIIESIFTVIFDLLFCLLVSGIVGLILGGLAGLLALFIKDYTIVNTVLYRVLLVVVVIGEIFGVYCSVDDIRDIFSERNYLKKIEENKQKRIQNIDKQNKLNQKHGETIAYEKTLLTNLKNTKAEHSKVSDFKKSLYNLDWIPLQYRNIRVIYYICDMISTSYINIEEALKYYLMQEANNKLDQIIERLDEIIENQNQIIINQAIIQSQNKELISKNKQMISQLASIEDNVKLSADYASVAANYSEVNAYLSMATYLKR